MILEIRWITVWICWMIQCTYKMWRKKKKGLNGYIWVMAYMKRTYMAYKEGENLNSFMQIKGWRVYGQPSYTILPFVEVELLSVNGAKFRATDGFPETGFDGAKFTLVTNP